MSNDSPPPKNATQEELLARAEKLNQEIAKQLGREPLTLYFDSSAKGLHVAYSPASERLHVTWGGLLLPNNQLQAAMAHEYGHDDLAADLPSHEHKMVKELYADTFVAKTCRPELVLAYKQYLAEFSDKYDMKLDEMYDVHPSVKTRSAHVDRSFRESCGVAPPVYIPKKKDPNAEPPGP